MMRKCLVIVLLILCNYLYAGTATLDVKIKNVSDYKTALNNQIAWSGVTKGTTDWKSADQYLKVTYYSDYAGWGLQIFTENTVTGASYKFTGKYVIDPNKDPAVSPNIGDLGGDLAAGLVHYTGKYRLPMCWRVTWPLPFGVDNPKTPQNEANEKTKNLNIIEVDDVDGDTGWKHLRRDAAENYNCWIHMKDKANDGWSNPYSIDFPNGTKKYFPNSTIKWTNGADYQTVVAAQKGIQEAEATFNGWGIGPVTDPVDGSSGSNYVVYVYPGAKFEKAAGGDYKTKIYVELYHY